MSEERMGETKERLEQIFRDYYQLIYRVAFSQVKNHADAEDITQEVFLKIIRHDMRYQSMEHERAWIVRVTINLCRDLLKSKWHKTSVSMEEVSEAQREEAASFQCTRNTACGGSNFSIDCNKISTGIAGFGQEHGTGIREW